jgi:hypothetical protein
MEEIVDSTMLEEEEDDDLLVYCICDGTKDIFSKKKRWILLQVDRKIFDGQ